MSKNTPMRALGAISNRPVHESSHTPSIFSPYTLGLRRTSLSGISNDTVTPTRSGSALDRKGYMSVYPAGNPRAQQFINVRFRTG